MTHLSPADFIDAADGSLPAARRAHLERCDRCREQAAMVRAALEDAGAAEVPEPSPLYWPHLAARVRERIADESIVPAWRAHAWRELVTVRRTVPMASAAALLAAVVIAGLMNRPMPLPPAPATTASAVHPVASDAAGDIEDSEAWDMLAAAAADTPIEEAHAAGLSVTAATVDRAVQRMNPEELDQLRQLLQSELRRPGD